MSDWTLGQTSSKFETGGRGPGTVSTGKGDNGGVSYGSYQLSTAEGSVQEFLRSNKDIGAKFKNLTPGTEAFSDQWKALASSDPKGFHAAQHDFIKNKFYDVQMGRLQEAGVDLSERGPAVQDMLWSTSVQYKGLTKNIVTGALKGKDLAQLSDADIVSFVQDYKRDHNSTLFASSKPLWPGLLQRAADEKKDLQELARSYGGDKVSNDKSQPAPLERTDATAAPVSPELSPESHKLIQDSRTQVQSLCDQHGLAWDRGMDNTVHALALCAKQQGMTEVTHIKVAQGSIRLGQFDGVSHKEGLLDAKEAANTNATDSVSQMAHLDKLANQTAIAPSVPSPPDAPGRSH